MRRGIARYRWLPALAFALWAGILLLHGFGHNGGRKRVPAPPAALDPRSGVQPDGYTWSPPTWCPAAR